MKRTRWSIFLTFFCVFGFCCSCIPGKQLKTEQVDFSEIRGKFDLTLYGCQHPNDIENVALLGKMETPYTIEIYAPSFQYRTERGLTGEEAVEKAKTFLQCSIFFQRYQSRKIIDPAGNTIGYEIRPLYSLIRFGKDDVLDIRYRVSGNKIVVYIMLDPQVEKFIRDQGGDNRHNGIGR